EQKLHESDNRYRAFVKNSTEGIWRVDFDEPIDIDLPEDEQFELVHKHGYMAEANDAYAHSVGFEHGEELSGARIAEFCPRSVPKNVATVKNWIRGRYNITNAETVESYKDGITRVILNNSTSIIEDGRVVRVWGTQTDITNRKQMEQKLIEAEQKYRTVADYTYDWEYWVAPDGSLNYVSPSCERVTGYCVSDFMARPELISEIVIPEDRFIWHRHGNHTGTEAAPSHIHFRIKAKDATIRWLAHVCQPVPDEKGNFAGVRASNRDITELRKAEQKVREHREMLTHMDRRATLGQLAGSIAHELNQPLTGILSDAQAGDLLLKKGNLNLQNVGSIFTDIIADAKRAGQVLRNLRDLFSDGKVEFNFLSINTLIGETLRIMNSELIGQSVTMYTDLSEGIPNVFGNRIQLQQVLINLINNSRQAMQHAKKADRWISISTAQVKADRVSICVEDNGPGIVREQLASIFDPLATTKRTGLGMGLAISHSIVQAHGGRIWVENTPKGGARFTFTLPTIEVR
ncbi:MAG: ATP-binding protein, partial [Desulfobacterales bacterium]